MGPAEFLDRRIGGGIGLFACDLPVLAGVFKLKLVHQKIAGHPAGGLAKDRKAREIFCAVSVLKIECQQRFLVTDISFYGKGMVGGSDESHGTTSPKKEKQYSPQIWKLQPMGTYFFVTTLVWRHSAMRVHRPRRLRFWPSDCLPCRQQGHFCVAGFSNWKLAIPA
jgi:hypothetical protein